jgi:hypothetical protein
MFFVYQSCAGANINDFSLLIEKRKINYAMLTSDVSHNEVDNVFNY